MQNSPHEKNHSEGVEKIYPNHANALRKTGLAPPIFPTMGELWKNKYENMDIENEKEPDVNRNKNRNVYLCIAYSRYFSTSIHRVTNKLKTFNLYWMRVRMSYHIFNILDELLNRYLAAKIGQVILS